MINSSTINLNALCQLQYGMYIVSTASEKKMSAQLATVVFQITNEPIQIATCLSKETLTHEYIEKSRKFAVSILEQETDMMFIGRFGFHSGRDFDKFANTNYIIKESGCPLITDHALAILEVDVNYHFDLSTHTLFAGKLVSSELLKKGTALTYDYYHLEKKGKTPSNAPTFLCAPKSL